MPGLNPQTSPDVAQALLAPYAPTRMRRYPITPYVNTLAHDDPHVLDPLPSADRTASDPRARSWPSLRSSLLKWIWALPALRTVYGVCHCD